MSEQRHRVQAASVDREANVVTVLWGDGHQSRYPFVHLRARCPCATCRAERDRERERPNPFRVLPASAGPAQTNLVGVEQVGRYGIQLAWGDGHATGIYSREYLREICPCADCTAAADPEGPFVHGIHIPA